MLIDGDLVQEGDRVYHASAGYGTVEIVQSDICRIRMDAGGTLNMRNGGYSGRMRVFYWYKPVAFTPRKGKEDIQRKALDVAIKAMDLIKQVEKDDA